MTILWIFFFSQASLGSAINTNFQGPKSRQLLVQLLPSFYFSRISMRMGVSREGSSLQLDCRRSRAFTSALPQAWAGGTHSNGGGHGCSVRGCGDALLPLLIPSVQARAGSEPCAAFTDRLLGGQKSKQTPCFPGLAIASTSERRALHETKEASPQINHQSCTNHLCVP